MQNNIKIDNSSIEKNAIINFLKRENNSVTALFNSIAIHNALI